MVRYTQQMLDGSTPLSPEDIGIITPYRKQVQYGIYDHKSSTFSSYPIKKQVLYSKFSSRWDYLKVQQVCLTLILGRIELTKFDIMFEFVLLTLLLCSVGILSVIAVMCLKSSLANPVWYVQVVQRVHCYNWIAAMAEWIVVVCKKDWWSVIIQVPIM